MIHCSRQANGARLASLLCLLATTTSCATRQAVTPTADRSDGEVSLQVTVEQLREAIDRWDVQAIAAAGERLEAFEPSDTDQAYWRQLWVGTAWFHVTLTQRPLDDHARGRAVQALQAALAYHRNDSDCHAMLAVIYGMSIRDKPWLVLQLGPKVHEHRLAAQQDRDRNPRVRYLEGVSMLNRAGDRDEIERAIESLLAADKLFEMPDEQPSQLLAPDWGRAQNCMFLGEAYLELNQPKEARVWFVAAIDIAPHLERARQGFEKSSMILGSKADG